MKKIVVLLSVAILLAACSTKQRVVAHSAFQAEKIASYDSISLLLDFSPIVIDAAKNVAKNIADSSKGSKPATVRITGSVHRNIEKTTQVEDSTISQKREPSQNNPDYLSYFKWVIIYTFIIIILLVMYKCFVK